MFLLLLLVFLLHRFSHQLLKAHVVSLFIGISFSLVRLTEWGKEHSWEGGYLLVNGAGKHKCVCTVDALLKGDGLVIQDFVTYIPQHALDLVFASSPSGC